MSEKKDGETVTSNSHNDTISLKYAELVQHFFDH